VSILSVVIVEHSFTDPAVWRG